jgi:hypothetical protein
MTCVNGLPPFNPHGPLGCAGGCITCRTELVELRAERDRLLLQNEVMQNALKEIAGSPSSYLWATLTGIAREGLATCAKKPKDETLTFSGCGHVLKAKDALCPICGV